MKEKIEKRKKKLAENKCISTEQLYRGDFRSFWRESAISHMMRRGQSWTSFFFLFPYNFIWIHLNIKGAAFVWSFADIGSLASTNVFQRWSSFSWTHRESNKNINQQQKHNRRFLLLTHHSIHSIHSVLWVRSRVFHIHSNWMKEKKKKNKKKREKYKRARVH